MSDIKERLANLAKRSAVVAATVAAVVAPTGAKAQTDKEQREGPKKEVVVDAQKANAKELFKVLDAFIENAPCIVQEDGKFIEPYKYDTTNNGVFRMHGGVSANGDAVSLIQYQDPALWAFTGKNSDKPKTQQSLDEMGMYVPLGGDITIDITRSDGTYEKYEVTQKGIKKFKLSENGNLIYNDSIASCEMEAVSSAEYKQLASIVAGVLSNCEKESKAPEVSAFCKKHASTTYDASSLFMGKTTSGR